MLVVTGRFQRPDAPTRAMTRSAVARCSSVCGKIAERYCVPVSLPWCLASWVVQRKTTLSQLLEEHRRVEGHAHRLGCPDLRRPVS